MSLSSKKFSEGLYEPSKTKGQARRRPLNLALKKAFRFLNSRLGWPDGR
jgi:hypothetical protein